MATFPNELITIFYSTTSDPHLEDRLEVLEKIKKMLKDAKKVAADVSHWESSVGSGLGIKSGQDVIDKKIGVSYDIYLGNMGPKYGADTVGEYQKAIASHINSGNPKHIIFGFDHSPVDPFEIPDNFSSVKEFKKNIADPVFFGRPMLYYSFSNRQEFEEKTFRSLCQAIEDIQSRISGGRVY